LCVTASKSIKYFNTSLLNRTSDFSHGRTGRKKIGGRKEICPNFSDYARPVPKFFFPEQLHFEDLPPLPAIAKKISVSVPF
jgi:hypothetical protein